jgi:DNA invertase Pin-like site-specific DNA recombinase
MKAILLVRVSTKAQDFDEQEREIYEMALRDGYAPEDIIPICEKESGIKLAEEERAGLNRMKELIEAGGIACVYSWEVSRIARKKKINFSVLDYLIEHKVQLIIKNPSIILFNSDGSINEGAETVFTLFSQLAESEMRTKLARFKRSKDARRKQGYFTGGSILYGYTTNNEKCLVPDETESAVVKMIYNMYLTGKYSYRSLAKELQENGIFIDKSFSTAQALVNHILNNTAYAGIPSKEGSRMKLKTDGNIYPALVTLEMIEKCKEIAKKNVIEPKKKYSTYYFGKNILRCPECGKVMMAVKARNFYHCTKCGCNHTININMVDSALWAVAYPLYAVSMLHRAEDLTETYNNAINILKDKIGVANNEIKKAEERAESIEYKAYVEGTMDIKKADKFIANINDKITTQRKQIDKFEQQIRDYERLQIENSSNSINIDDVGQLKDDKVRFEIIHQMLTKATIRRVEGCKMKTIITIWDINGTVIEYLLDSRKHKIINEDGEEVVGVYEERFKSNYQADGKDKEARQKYLKEYRQKKSAK